MLTRALAISLLALALPAAAPAATVTSNTDGFGNGSIQYLAGPGEANDVFVERVSEGVRVRDGGASILPGGDCRADGAAAAICPVTGNLSSRIDLGDGNDRLEWQIGFADVRGGVGDDRIRASGAVDGGPGADAMQAHYVDYATRTAGVQVSVDDEPDDGEPGEGDNVMTGVHSIAGGSGPDVISAVGVGGSVVLIGNGGDDRLIGGAAPDGLGGGPGADHLDGGPNVDRLNGGPGDDVILGGGDEVPPGAIRPFPEEVEGGPGRDRVAVGGGAKLDLRDGERDEATCGVPGAHLHTDPSDATIGCRYTYLRFSPATRAYTSRAGRVHVRATCFASLGRQCDGAVRLLLGTTRTVLASGPFHLQPGETERLELKLRSVGKRLQRRRTRVKARVVAVHGVASDPPPENDPDARDPDSRNLTWVTRR